MNAISLYVSASRLLFQSDTENPNYTDLYRLVPYLRQSLSCSVCANLLVEPYSPQEVCQHHVCRNCIGGRKNLKPTCSSCKNYHNYQANTQLRILLQCYKSLCNYILATPIVYSSMHNYVHVDAFSNGNTEAHNLAELIDEGAQFHDEYKSNSGLSKSAFSILPCIFTTTSMSNNSQNHSTNVNVIANNSKPTIINTTASSSSSNQINVTPKIEHPTFVRSVVQTTNSVPSVSSTSERKNENTITVVASPNLIKNQPIKTVSNGTALYSVLYTGTGNKITIKRKTDDNNFNTAKTMSTRDMINILNANAPRIQQMPQVQQIQPQISLQQVQPIQIGVRKHQIHFFICFLLLSEIKVICFVM